MRTLTEWAVFIGLESILSLSMLGIILAMQSKPYPFQTDLQKMPFAMIGLILLFMFLVWIGTSGREETELDRGKGRG